MSNISSDSLPYAKLCGRLMPPAEIAETCGFIGKSLNADGGFRNRYGRSDPYYTLFGVMSSIALAKHADSGVTMSFLIGNSRRPDLKFTDLISISQSLGYMRKENPGTETGNEVPDAIASVLKEVEKFRASDGTYSHVSRNAGWGTVYAVFTILQTYEICGLEHPEARSLVSKLQSLLLPDGSYSNDREFPAGTSTATAAALISGLASGIAPSDKTVKWLKSCFFSEDGGFRAFKAAPVSDMLSTSASLFALKTAGESLDEFRGPVASFVKSMLCSDGGFRGYAMEPQPDVEFTYYGLLSIGILGS